MNKLHLSTRLRMMAYALAASVAIISLSGCDLTGMASPSGPMTESAVGVFAGNVHGGQQPIYNATVNLYAAGTTGYGSAPTLLATTTTNLSGGFQFIKLPNGSANSGSSWSCPASDPNPDPQIYVTAVGGNSQGTGVTSTNNSAAALILALGPCSALSSSSYFQMNEVTSVATIFALAQYINPGTTPGTESIGTNGGNLSVSTPRGAVGLNNAVSLIQNLSNVVTGSVPASMTYTGTNASVTSVVVTATAESAKLITIANIIAACINTSASNSAACTSLFGAATPPPNASVTSQPNANFGAAQDTIQAAYYMAVNPIDAGQVYSPCGTSTTNLQCLFNLASATPPFGGSLTATPTDWTIGVTYTSTGACTYNPSSTFINIPAKVAVDAVGNLWFANGANPGGIAGMSPVGQPVACVSSSTGAANTGAGIAIDPSGNVWGSFSGSSNGSYSVLELTAGNISSATTGTSWQPPFGADTLTIDGNGNVFISGGNKTNPNMGGVVYELPNPGPTTYTAPGGTYSAAATFPATLIASGVSNVTGSTLNPIDFMAVDQTGNIYAVSGYSAGGGTNQTLSQLAPTSLSITGYSIAASNMVTFTTSTAPPATLASGQNIVVNGLTTTNALPMNHQGFTVSATSTSFPFSVTGTLITSPNTGTGADPSSPKSPSLTVTAQTSDTGTLTGYSLSLFTGQTTSHDYRGAAVDSNGYLYTGTQCCNSGDRELYKITPAIPFTSSTSKVSPGYIGGDNGIKALTLDGAANVWFGSLYPSQTTVPNGQATYFVGEASAVGSGTSVTFTALSPAGTAPGTCSTSSTTPTCASNGGFVKSTFAIPTDLAIDSSGNVWVPNTDNYVLSGSTYTLTPNGTSITQIVGAAVPTVTPLSVAAANGTLATKP